MRARSIQRYPSTRSQRKLAEILAVDERDETVPADLKDAKARLLKKVNRQSLWRYATCRARPRPAGGATLEIESGDLVPANGWADEVRLDEDKAKTGPQDVLTEGA